ncbi:TrmH family RNA methyltransferase [Streptomyces aidingensis]|uniref:tRNA G18 (Ribose-2'-O)-methylase SpoU n=1 Tax=Streptomyces aidingensis TaxID=910347 RepID=A0A1I1RVA4_9ACTN|nr:RNA methyltransferase [Streptomyces aidingensis]SFD38249.1 tRNA G18 (ribose-2'-O)-methylase SpoU [Streptomyces aidingensis]
MTVRPAEITDPADPRLSDYTSLTDVALRRVREPAEGLFMAEGEKVIRRALEAGYRMRSMLLTPRWADAMRDLTDAGQAPVYLVSPELAERVTGFHVHRGALAAMARKPLPGPAALLSGLARAGSVSRIAVLEDIVDHANVGAAFRSAAALGMDAVLVTPGCADPLYRRSVKVSMGAVLRIPWTRTGPWPAGGLSLLREAGYLTAALALAPDAVTLDEFAARHHPRIALILGTEGAGLGPATLAGADVTVRIPMAAGVDSLNVAAASAVAFYTLAPGRRR